MEWVLGAVILLCVLGVVVVVPVAWKQEVVQSQARQAAQDRVKSLEQACSKLQLEQTTQLKGALEQELQAKQSDVERLSQELAVAQRKTHDVETRAAELERKLTEEHTRYHVDIEALRQELKRLSPVGPVSKPGSPLSSSEGSQRTQVGP